MKEHRTVKNYCLAVENTCGNVIEELHQCMVGIVIVCIGLLLGSIGSRLSTILGVGWEQIEQTRNQV